MEYESLRYPSWCLCRLLENITGIGTEEQVALKRKLWSTHNYVNNVFPEHKVLFSGSKSEGFDFKSSDFDVMVIDRYTVPTESTQYVQPNDHSKTMLLMRRDMCNPGFVILQLLNRTNHRGIRESLVEYGNSAVVSNVLYRDQYTRPEFGMEGHGPCNTFKAGHEFDMAFCFECEWPSQAYEFIYRPRPHGWPSKCFLNTIISYRCHLVPIGDKDHKLSYIQWRLSFSAAEKALIHSFNHTQFLVYGLLKIFLKQVINKVKSAKDLLCSYFLKTVLFYSIECTPRSFWREDLIIPCFWFCFIRLIQWVECGYCPNFFVPENNMFRNKVYGENQHKLLTVLRQLKSSGWTCICLCDDLRSFQNVLNYLEPAFHYGLIPSEVSVERRLDIQTFSMMETINKFTSLSCYGLMGLSRSFIPLCYSRSLQERDISVLHLFYSLRSAGRFYFCSEVGRNNKARYRSFRKCQILLQRSADTDLSVGPLTLATYYYTTGQYNKAVQMCQRVTSRWKPFVLYGLNERKRFAELYELYVCGRGVNLVDKVRKACAGEIVIGHGYKDLYPAELIFDIEANSLFGTIIPPLPYTVFLLCLCHNKLGNIDSSLTALHDLQILIYDDEQGYRRCPVVLNLLAICLEKLGYVDRAIDMYLQSQELNPDRNGAGKLLEKLLCNNTSVSMHQYM